MKDPYEWTPAKGGVLKGTHHRSGSVRWRVRYRPRSGAAQTSKTFDSLEEARRFKLEVDSRRQRQRDGNETMSPKRTPAFGVYVTERFMRRYIEGSGTWRSYNATFKELRRVDPDFDRIPVGLIRKADIEILLARHEAAGYQGSTTNKLKRAVMTVLNHAADNGVIARLHVRIPLRRERRPTIPPTPAELAQLLAAASDRVRVPLLVCATTGARNGEVRGLAVGDVRGLAFTLERGWHRDSDDCAVRVAAQLDPAAQHRTLPKTAGSQRWITVLPEVVDAIAGHLTEHGVGPTIDAAVLLFAVRPGVAWTERRLLADLHAASDAALGRRIKVHTLRRFYGTALIYGGMPVHAVQREMGHASPQMTMRLYVEAMAAMGDEGAQRRAAFGGLFADPVAQIK